MKFDILKTNSDFSVCSVWANEGNFAKLGMIESSLKLKNFVLA